MLCTRTLIATTGAAALFAAIVVQADAPPLAFPPAAAAPFAVQGAGARVMSATDGRINPYLGEPVELGRLKTQLAVERMRTQIADEVLKQRRADAEFQTLQVDAQRRLVGAPATAAMPTGLQPAVPLPAPPARPATHRRVLAKRDLTSSMPVQAAVPVPPKLLAILTHAQERIALLAADKTLPAIEARIGESVAGYRVVGIGERTVELDSAAGRTRVDLRGTIGRLAAAAVESSSAPPAAASPVARPGLGAEPELRSAFVGPVAGLPQPPMPIADAPGLPNPLQLGPQYLPPAVRR